MISRIWHGWTIPGDANKYEVLLKEEIFAGIQNRHIRGFNGIQLLRREVREEVGPARTFRQKVTPRKGIKGK
jgi:hypothetical protein